MTNNKQTARSRQLARSADTQAAPPAKAPQKLVAELRKLIEESRQAVAQTVNTSLVWLYWSIGKRIREDVLKKKRADYGEQIVQTLSAQLMVEYGRGFSRRNLFNMIRFAEVFQDQQIVHSLSAQLTWTHFRELLPFDDHLQRDFYAEMMLSAPPASG